MLQRIHLEIVKALDDTGSLTGAAEKLNLTQSALTHSIKKLETLTGATIWNKEGRQLRLTEAGRLLLSSAHRLLPQLENIDKGLKGFGEGRLGTLTIGVECHPCFEWLVQIVKGFLKEWPQVDLDVTKNFQFDGLEALKNHKVNMLVTPDFLLGKGILHYDVLDFELQLMVSENHRLASKAYLSPGDLDGEVLYTYPVEKSRLDIFSLGIRPQKHIPMEATEIMVQLVASNRGVSAFPHWLIERYTKEFPVKGIPLKKEGFPKKLYLVIREEDRDLSYIKSFIATAELLSGES